MKNRGRITIAFMALGTLLALFQNCAPAEFSMAPEPAASQAFSAPPVSEISQALTACDQLSNPKMMTEEVPVFFDNPLNEVGSTPVCSWNQAGNIAVNNGYMTARYTQTRSIPLPAGAILCNVDFEFATQAMKYDDMFFFAVNDVILAASDDYWQKNYLTHRSLDVGSGSPLSTHVFDWAPIVGRANSTRANLPDGRAYCLGESEGLSNCSWPVTEVAGRISMSVAPKIMTALGLAARQPGLKLDFITTGDDDITKDCQHEPLSMRLKIRYIAP